MLIGRKFLLPVKNLYSDMFDKFHTKITSIIDKHIPIRKLSKKEVKIKNKPWITRAIKVSIRIKNGLHKQFIKTQSSYYYAKFKIYRNKLNHLIRISKRQYYNNFLNYNCNNTKKLWQGVKKII
jgi:hypothetical protein